MTLVDTKAGANKKYARSLARAFGGAVIFSLPLLMTMEMWSLGFTVEPWRLLQFVALNFLVLTGLARVSGFEPTTGWGDAVLDAFSAFGIAVAATFCVLALIGVIRPEMTLGEVAGKVAIQSVPASFGAMIASSQLGGRDEAAVEGKRDTYGGELFLMLAGALFLSFNIAPTEEILLIALQMSPGQEIVLILLSIILLHAFVYGVGFRGEHQPPEATGFFAVFVRFSIVGYAIAVLVSLYVLWTFGRTESGSVPQIASLVAVLAFPGAIGAAIARLVV